MAVSYAARLRLGVGGAALDSRLPFPVTEKERNDADRAAAPIMSDTSWQASFNVRHWERQTLSA